MSWITPRKRLEPGAVFNDPDEGITAGGEVEFHLIQTGGADKGSTDVDGDR